ncbi:HECT-domain (ubiquitin-transferase) [Fragilaria crotonensis]|nr:HECT-domain (ubiquitin-transferase) [Fragilaria crotonensis]
MSGEQLPSGRERAIETLIDSEPNGASYRANRIRDELVPNALSSRPNLITRSALIEQAHSLAEYEIDSSDKYMDAFGLKDLDGSSDTENAFSEATVQRILRHHEKIVAIKSQKAAATPPPQLVANLKSLYGSDLHKNVLHHKAFDNDEIDNPKNDGILESIIGTVCRDVCDGLKEDALHGLLLAVLSVLTGLDHDGAEVPDLSQGKAESRAIERRHDPSDVPALQVGAILSLMRSNVEKGPFSLDEKVLKYLGDAASAYEDRIDVQKARLLARAEQEAKVVRVDRKQQKTVGSSIEDDDNITIPIAPFVPTDASEPSAVVVEDDTLPNHEDQAVEGNDPDEEEDEEDDEGCDDDDDDDDDNIGNDLLRPTVFNQIISAVADGVDRAALRLAAGGLEQDSSDSDSTNDNDSDHNLDRYAHEDNAPHVELDDESSSSDEEDESEPSPEVVDDDDDDHEGEDDEDDDDDDDDDEEDAGDSILRQALAMSLSDHTGFAEAPGSNFQSSEGPEDDKDDDILLSTPKPESRRSSRSKFDFSDSDHPNLNDLDALPDLPMPPSIYPYWSSLDSVTDVDDKSDPAASLHPCLDPSALSKFGTVPSSLALVRLLQNTLGAVTGHLAQGRKQRSGENGIKSGTVPGGMGCMLFGSEAQLSDDRKVDMDDEFNRTAASLQLLVATVVLCFESRKEAIEGLREAISAEQRNVQGTMKHMLPRVTIMTETILLYPMMTNRTTMQ